MCKALQGVLRSTSSYWALNWVSRIQIKTREALSPRSSWLKKEYSVLLDFTFTYDTVHCLQNKTPSSNSGRCWSRDMLASRKVLEPVLTGSWVQIWKGSCLNFLSFSPPMAESRLGQFHSHEVLSHVSTSSLELFPCNSWCFGPFCPQAWAKFTTEAYKRCKLPRCCCEAFLLLISQTLSSLYFFPTPFLSPEA